MLKNCDYRNKSLLWLFKNSYKGYGIFGTAISANSGVLVKESINNGRINLIFYQLTFQNLPKCQSASKNKEIEKKKKIAFTV